MKHILGAVDFSDVTERQVACIGELAQCSNAEVCLLHVELPEPEFVGYDPGPQYVRDNVAREIQNHKHSLEALAEQLRSRGLSVQALLFQGYPVETILKEADRLAAYMLVLGSHGHGALHHLLMGSVCAGVLRKVRCPVVIVPSVAP